MRRTILAVVALLTGALASPAAVTVQALYHLGEPGSFAGGLPADSSGNGHNLSDGFSEFESIHISPDTPGGPLGTSGIISTNSSEWGRNGDVIIAGADNYAISGTNFGIEAWVLPYGNGYNIFCCEAQQHYIAQIFASGGDTTGLFFGVTNNQDGTYSFVANAVTDIPPGYSQVGDTLPLVTNAWTHLAVVNNQGTNIFYVNGVQHGPVNTDTLSTNTPTGTGSQNSFRMGASGGDHLAFRGLIDEARGFTFAPGSFAVTDLLYPSASATTPLIVTEPANTAVWDGGPAPFSIQLASSPSLTYQWKRGPSALFGQTQPNLLLPSVTHGADDGATFSCLVTNTGSGKFTNSSAATLSVPLVQTNGLANYRNLVTSQSSLVGYFPADFNTGTTLGNIKTPANSGTLEGAAAFDSRTDRAFGQKALLLDRGANLGDVMLANDNDYSFPGGVGTIEAAVYMNGLGVYINGGGPWTFPTIFSIGEPDRTTFYTLVGVSKTGDAIEFNDGTTTTAWTVPKNLVGRFAHIALVFQPGGITAYADGRSLGTQATFSPALNSSPAWIGSAGSYTNSFTGPVWNGTIDELAIYTNALSASTINTHYAMLTYGTNTSPVVLSPPSSVTILAGAANNTAVFSVDAEGSLPLGYQWKSNNVPIPGQTSPTLTLNNATPSYSATYSVTVSNVVGTTNVFATLAVVTPTGYPAVVTADHPVGYWRLGEGAGPTALDSWGTHNGTYRGNETFARPGAVVGDPNTSVDFSGDAAPSMVAVPYSSDFNGGPDGSWTVECWVNPDLDAASEGFAVPVGSVNATGADRSGYFFLLQPTGWQLRLGNTAGYLAGWNGAAGSVGPVPQVGSWTHLVGAYDGTAANGYIYVNGVQVKSAAVADFAPNPVASFNIGDRGDGAGWAGRVDEVAVYSSVLPAARVAAHYFAGQPPVITVTRSGSNISLSWPTGVGVLYQSSNADGPYTIVSPVSNPYPVTPSQAKQFYLLRKN